jgi:hypothetical protein
MVSPCESMPSLIWSRPPRSLELDLLLVDVLREQEPALAGRHRRALDDLHAIE